MANPDVYYDYARHVSYNSTYALTSHSDGSLCGSTAPRRNPALADNCSSSRRTNMTHWQSGDVEANGLRLHYTRTAGAGPQVVLAHGFSDDGLCWTPLAEALAPEY